eukprot:CAMPEP_0114455182 /NCGR_PEP_ID=MMETSP0104-20121206/2965_1 /TAXON_ID=37642 ORGANISM="Paraphysomonas imperforata, Strain PA2" /NCGR_SAMPLE_ID=MMETSP0104 /ASSEMBLY_ACC=CAM_ASM_000202 /LENGTH=471 /DNA_ID=CAMNT_0001627589 /DNA_START=27 /DNA_END=1442 /DNA_ORIENTATION=-
MSTKVVHPSMTKDYSDRQKTFEGERSEMNIHWQDFRTDNSLTHKDFLTMLKSVFRWNVCLTVCLGVCSVYAAGRLKLKWDSDLSVIQFGILFPMVFMLTQAYNRRESCLDSLAGFKSSIYSLYWIHRDWALADDDTPREHKIRHIENTYNTLMELVCNFRCFLQTTHHDAPHHIDCYHDQVYKCISQLTVLGRQSFLDDCLNEASLFRYEVMRQKLVEYLEKIRVLRDYRTPRTLIFMTTFLLNLGCVVLAPYFNSFCSNSDDHACGAAYLMGVAYALVLFNIHNVVSDLESSFDHIGVDDIRFNIREHLSRLHHGVPAAFFKHDDDGHYIIQSPRRFELTNGILGLHPDELDMYLDMNQHSSTLSHSENYADDSITEMRKKINAAKAKMWTHGQAEAVAPRNMRSFGQAVLQHNKLEVNRFSQRGGKKQKLISEDEVESVHHARRATRAAINRPVFDITDIETKDALDNV